MKLTDEQIQTHLETVAEWSLDSAGKLTRTFKRKHFMDGLNFVNLVAELAEKAEHHPDVLLTWPSVTVSLTTHDVGGLSEKDFALAAQIDALV